MLSSVAGALKVNDRKYFPNTFVLLKIVAIVQLIFVNVNIRFPKLRRLKIGLRSNMETSKKSAFDFTIYTS